MIGQGFKALSVVASVAFATPALAHEFTVAIVVPLSGPDASIGQAALNGFRTATRERDGHANETSEGHLGGVDVQMEPIDSATGAAALIGAVKGLGAVVVYAPDARVADTLTAGLPDAVVLGPDSVSAPPKDFAQRYTAEHGIAPTTAAESGYGAAQRIDRAVRAAGTAEDPAALRAAFSATKPPE